MRAVRGTPTLRASFSESGRFIDEDGDNGGEGPCCGNASPAAEPFRWNEFHPTGPGVLRTTYQQGGQRFERIALTSPGRVRLRRVGIEFKAFRATPREYQGWFLSSDDTINKIWYAAAYTDQLNMVPRAAQNNNPEPAVIDGAKRDRLSWSGDTLVQGPSIWNHLGTRGSEYVKATLWNTPGAQARRVRLRPRSRSTLRSRCTSRPRTPCTPPTRWSTTTATPEIGGSRLGDISVDRALGARPRRHAGRARLRGVAARAAAR